MDEITRAMHYRWHRWDAWHDNETAISDGPEYKSEHMFLLFGVAKLQERYVEVCNWGWPLEKERLPEMMRAERERGWLYD